MNRVPAESMEHHIYVALTKDEWRALRLLAMSRDETVKVYVARVLKESIEQGTLKQ